MSSKFKIVAALVVAVIAISAIYAINRVTHTFGTVSTSCSGYTTCFSDLYAATTWGGSGSIRAAGTLVIDGASTLTGLLTDAGGFLKTNVNATTSPASLTIQGSDLAGYDTVILTPTVASETITFPASSTLSTWLPSAGNAQDTCFINGTTTSAIVITFAGGTGTLLQVASSSVTALGAVTLYPQKMGCFHFTRSNATATTFDIIAAYTAFK